jgi:phage-related protein
LKNKINDSRGLLVSKDLAGGRIARVLFCIEPDCIVLLHGFMKKAQKTPQQEIDLAIKRMKGERG